MYDREGLLLILQSISDWKAGGATVDSRRPGLVRLLAVRVVVVRALHHVVILDTAVAGIAVVLRFLVVLSTAKGRGGATVAHAFSVVGDIVDVSVVAVRLTLLSQAEAASTVGEIRVVLIVQVILILDGAGVRGVLSHGSHAVVVGGVIYCKDGGNVSVIRYLLRFRRG